MKFVKYAKKPKECRINLMLSIEQREKYNTQVERYKATINKHYLRKPQKEAFECSARCCDVESPSMKEFEYCLDMCFAKTDDQRQYGSSAFNRMHRDFKESVRVCRRKARQQLKIGKDPLSKSSASANEPKSIRRQGAAGEPGSLPHQTQRHTDRHIEDDFVACADLCVEQNTFKLSQMAKQVAKDLENKFN